MKTGMVCVAALAALALGSHTARAQEADGQAVYAANCAACHGKEGVPPASMLKAFKTLPTFADPALLKDVSEDSTVVVIENGVGMMTPFKGTLTREQVIAVAKYIRTLAKHDPGTSAPALAPDRSRL